MERLTFTLTRTRGSNQTNEIEIEIALTLCLLAALVRHLSLSLSRAHRHTETHAYMLRSVLRVAVLGGRRSSLSFAPLIDPIGRSGTKHHRASLWRCQYSSTTKLAALVRDGNHQHDNSDVAQHTNADNCATPFDRDPSVETAAAAFRAIIKKQRQKVEERARKAATLAAMQADRNAVVPSLTNGTDAMTTTTTTTTSSTSNLTAQVDDGTVPDTAGDLAAVEVFEASKLQPEEVEDYVLPPLEQCLRSPPSLTQDARLRY